MIRLALRLTVGIMLVGGNPAVAGTQPSDSLRSCGSFNSALGEYSLLLPVDYPVEAGTFLRELTADVALALISRFGPVEHGPFQLVIVNSREQLEAWVGGELPDWIHAVAQERPLRVIVLGPTSRVTDLGSHRFEQALMHELTHIYLYRLYPRWRGGPLPGWFHEGLAVDISGGLDRGMHRALIRGRITGRFYALEQLDRIYHTSTILSELAYAQSVVAAQTMAAFYGELVFQAVFDEIRAGRSFHDAFAQVTGEALPLFQARYQAELHRRYNLLLVLADPAVLFILLPLLVLAAYFIRVWRNRAIAARWNREDVSTRDSLGDLVPPGQDGQVKEQG